MKTDMPSSALTVGAARCSRDPQEAPARRGERPLPAGVALHLDAVAHRRGGQPRAGRLLVDVAGLELEQVHLLPRQAESSVAAASSSSGAPLSTATFPAASRTSWQITRPTRASAVAPSRAAGDGFT